MEKLRSKDIASFHNKFCYTGEELREYRFKILPHEKRLEIFHHLNVERCPKCRSLYQVVSKSLEDGSIYTFPPVNPFIKKQIEKIFNPRFNPDPINLEKGQIWTTLPQIHDRKGNIIETVPFSIPVLIIYPGNGQKDLRNFIRVIPISFDVDYQFKNESLVLDKTSPTGFPILLEIFNERPMLAGNLDQYRGMVSASELKRIARIKERFRKGQEDNEDDPEYLKWKQREIKLTEYLSFPVNEALWEEDDEKVIELIPYRKAAETSGIDFDEMKTFPLMDTGDVSLWVVQMRDKVLLRFSSNIKKLKKVSIDKINKTIRKIEPWLFEVEIGFYEAIPEIIELVVLIDKEPLTFKLRLSKGKV